MFARRLQKDSSRVFRAKYAETKRNKTIVVTTGYSNTENKIGVLEKEGVGTFF